MDRVGGNKMIVEANKVGKESGTEFLISGDRLAFANLKKAFNVALILHYFDLKYYLWKKINALGYAISGILS